MMQLVVMQFKTSLSQVNILGKVNPRILSASFTLVVTEERWHVESKQDCGGKRTTSYISSCFYSCFQSKWLILYCICLSRWPLSTQHLSLCPGSNAVSRFTGFLWPQLCPHSSPTSIYHCATFSALKTYSVDRR